MKTISNFLLLAAGFSIPFIYGNKLSTDKFIKVDTITLVQHKIDSIDNKILKINGLTATAIKNNNKILQNTKEELLYLDFCLDSGASKNSLESTNTPTNAPLTNDTIN